MSKSAGNSPTKATAAGDPVFLERLATLTESDKSRLIAVLLNSTLSMTDWDAAANQFGSASTNSMRVMYGTAMRKMKGEAKSRAKNGNDSPSNAETPKKKRKKADPADDQNPEKRIKAEDHDEGFTG